MAKTIDNSKYSKRQTGGFKPVAPKMREGGFIRLRSGIFDHVAAGKMTPHDFAVYLTLHKRVNWRSGVCETTAGSLASSWGDWGSTAATESDTEEKTTNRKKRTIQNCLKRLRERGYIKYRDGDGKRGLYPILIDKYEPTIGALVGWSLDAEATTDYTNPIYRYVSPTPFVEAYGEMYAAQHMTACADHVRSAVQSVSAALYGLSAVNGTPDCTVRVLFQDVLEMAKLTLEVQEDSKKSPDGSKSSIVGDSLHEGTDRDELDFLNDINATSFGDDDDDDLD